MPTPSVPETRRRRGSSAIDSNEYRHLSRRLPCPRVTLEAAWPLDCEMSRTLLSNSLEIITHMRAYTGIVVAERPSIGNRPLVRFCPIGEPDRRLRLTRLEAGDVGLLADEELDLSPFIGQSITVIGRAGRNWMYGVNAIRTETGRPTGAPEPIERTAGRASTTAA